MIITEQFQVMAARQAVWDYFMNVQEVAACMPGVQSVEPLGPDTYKVAVAVKVGPIKAAFSGQVAIVESHPPERFRVTADWSDQNTASKTQVTADVELEERADGVVNCRLKVEVAILGVLGKYGQGVAVKKAAEIREAFSACVRAALEPQVPGPAATPATGPAPIAGPVPAVPPAVEIAAATGPVETLAPKKSPAAANASVEGPSYQRPFWERVVTFLRSSFGRGPRPMPPAA